MGEGQEGADGPFKCFGPPRHLSVSTRSSNGSHLILQRGVEIRGLLPLLAWRVMDLSVGLNMSSI